MALNLRNRNLIGIASLIMGVLIFSLQDAIIKALSGDYPVTLAIVLRSLVALPILTIMVQMESGIHTLSSKNFGFLVLRGGILLVSYTTYYMALPALPLAQAIALFFMAPIFVTLLSQPMLGERVSGRAWLAVVAGFVGVLVILQPGSSLFEPAALLSLVSAATYALSMVLARRLGNAESATVMAFYVNAVYMAGAAAIAMGFGVAGIGELGHPSLDFLVRGWVWPTLEDFLLMGLCGVIAAIAMYLLTHAYRMAEASLVTVFEYTGMVWGPLWGFMFFSEIPRLTTVIGTTLIIVAGVFAVRSATRLPDSA